MLTLLGEGVLALRDFHGTLVMVTHDRYFAESVGYTRHWTVAGGELRVS